MAFMDIPTGFTGFTVDVFDGSVSDSEGDVTKVLFAITFQERLSDVQFSITNGSDHWSAMTPTGEYIALRNPRVVNVNCLKVPTDTGGYRYVSDAAAVIFDMDEKYPSNSLMTLCARNTAATYNITPVENPRPFSQNTLTGSIGFTSNEYGGGTNDEGEVERIVFNISFSNRRNEVEFEISEDDDSWAAMMGDGSTICLRNPHVLFQNRDGATIVFQMYDPAQKDLPLAEQWCGYPSNSPGILVRRKEEARWTISEIDEDHPFIPVQNIVFPDYIPVGERINLHSQVVVYPMNATIRSIEWSVRSASATEAQVSNGWITTVNPGKITLTARIPNGLGIGTDFFQDVDIFVIENWITINEHPHLANAIIAGRITEELAVLAQTEFGDITYQWYRSNDNSNESGTAIANANGPIYKIPKHLVPGNYYYFCEIRKTNFPSVRTKVAYVRVRDDLRSLSIYPGAVTIPPGAQQQFAVDRNPTTSDEALPTHWFTSDSGIISIDENGLATSHNPGTVTITARVGTVETSVLIRATYVAVDSIQFDMPKTLETGKSYNLPTVVTPSDASFRDITWEVTNGGTTGAIINNGVLSVSNVGKLTIRGTIVNGLNPTTNFSQEFSLEVEKAYVPVTDISLNTLNKPPRVGEVVALRGTVIPASATAQYISWSIASAGSTRARLVSGNLLSVEAPGNVIITATVVNGLSAKSNFQKNYTIEFKSAFVPVTAIDGIPAEIDYFEGEYGFLLEPTVVPANADNKKISFRISPDDDSGLQPSFKGNRLFFDPNGMTHEDTISIRIIIGVKNGLADGVDYLNEAAIYIAPPASPDVFVPIQEARWELPTNLRAYRPILIDKTSIVPYDASRKNKIWSISREGDIEGSSAIMFLPTKENHQDLLDNGVLFTDEYDWEFKGNYIYPMSGGKLRVTLTVMDGLEIGTNFSERKVLNIKDPFIPVLNITNIPSSVTTGTKVYLSPEIDTGDGMNEQTAMWDDRVPSYSDIRFEILKGKDLATVNQNGDLNVTKAGDITLLLTVDSGRQEEFTWHGDVFDKVDYTKKFIIRASAPSLAEKFAKNRIITLTLANKKTVGVYTRADYEKLRAIRPADSTLTIGQTTFARKDVVAITFESAFKYTDLSNFGRNMVNLTKINKIPDSAKNLRNFLMGCSRFNQLLTIPKNVNGERCLEGFLRDCVNFNQPVTIPTVNGTKCLESFLRGCVKFNRTIKLPAEIRGNYAMYSFLQGCTAFNSPITLPKKISGTRCMENVLRDCVNFNQQITLPEDISGHYNFAAFMFNCKAFTKPVIVPTEAFGEHVMNDVITMATFYRDSALANAGTNIFGPGAAKFQETVGNQGSAEFLPLRTLNLNGETEIPEPEIPESDGYVGLTVLAEAKQNADSDEYAIGDPVELVIEAMNNSEKLKLTNLSLESPIPEALMLQSIETTKDIKVIKTLADDSEVEETVHAPEAEHVHSFNGGYQYDADGHWQKCDGCEVLSEKAAHVANSPATMTEHCVCSICGYVIEHAQNGLNAGDPDCEHLNTELRDVIEATTEADGYSGDLYCADCDRLIAVGHVVPKIVAEPEALTNESASPEAGSPVEGENEGENVGVAIKRIAIKPLDQLDVGENLEIHLKTEAVAAGGIEFVVNATYDEAEKAEDPSTHVVTNEITILEAHSGTDEGSTEENPNEGTPSEGGGNVEDSSPIE